MTAANRQNALFVSEEWTRIYESLVDIDFTAYDQNSLRAAIIQNINLKYPDEFNDWIQSSEFIVRLDTICYLCQSIAYRFDLNTRETHLSEAERRQSVINLVSNITYPINRVQGASGELKITSVKTNQRLFDLDDNSLANRVIKWNDPVDTEWFDKWLTVMNAVFDSRTKWGKPLRRNLQNDNETSLYRLNSPSPPTGSYAFSKSIGAVSLPFCVTNVLLDETTGIYSELAPNPDNGFHVIYRNDNLGANSTTNGFFFPIKQGTINYTDFNLSSLESLRILDINTPNINNSDVWLCKIDEDGNVLEVWDKADNVLNESLAYNTNQTRKVFEVISRDKDQIAIRFGDGKFGEIPQGIFRVWFRTSSPTPYLIKNTDIQNQSISIPYVSNGQIYTLVVQVSLQESISNASATETIEEIKNKANKVFYTQNRMVNGEDYNNFPLKDNSILKVKTVNRVFAGKSKNLNIKDNTGAYDNINLIGSDGRIYKEEKITVTQFTYNQTLLSLDTFIEQTIVPMLRSQDKQIFYYNKYKEISYNQDLFFTVDSTTNNRSRGHFNINVLDDIVNYFTPNTILTFENGETARLDYIVENTTGTENNTVILKKNIELEQGYIKSIWPALRTSLTQPEKNLIVERFNLKKSFGIRWDFTTQSYLTIKTENLNNEDFDLTFAGDNSASNKDASWLIKMDYNYSQNGEDYWTISQRGLFYVLESENEIKFIHTNDLPIIDNVSGRQLKDTVSLLGNNETKKSLNRRGVKRIIGNDPYSGKIIFTGDGTTRLFEIFTDKISEQHIFFEEDGELVSRSDWSLKQNFGRYFIQFTSALDLGEIVTVVYDPRKVILNSYRIDTITDENNDTYSLLRSNNRIENTFVFKNGGVLSCHNEYAIYPTSLDDRLKLSTLPEDEKDLTIFTYSGGEPVFNSYTFITDGVTNLYPLRMSTSFVMVFVDGVLRSDYTKNSDVQDSETISFNNILSANSKIHIRALLDSSLIRIDQQTFTASAGQQQFNVPVDDGKKEKCLVFKNGVFQHTAVYDDNLDDVFLTPAAQLNDKITVIHFSTLASNSSSYEIIARSEFNGNAEYIKNEIPFLVYGQDRFFDGYTNTRAILITNIDADQNGEIDNPRGFSDFVIEDGLSDLVLWKKITENNFDIWSPISETSNPRGTYHSANFRYHQNDSLTDDIQNGWIHYDYPNDEWLFANTETNVWELAPDQTAFKKLIGRNGINFVWKHYTSSDQKITPSSGNIHDIYVLTKEYDTAVRQWIIKNDGSAMPQPPSTSSLKTQYQYLLNHKMISDGIIWNPARYKFLFGPQAVPELQTKFLVIKTPGSTIPDNDLKLRILEIIDRYFDISNWDFGNHFYFTELASFVHTQLATHVQSLVPVALNGEPFGRVFEVRCEPNEIFFSTASPTQIEIVDSLTDSRLNIRS